MRYLVIILWAVSMCGAWAPLARAAAGDTPETNTICWTEDQCNEARKQLNPVAVKGDGGWVQEPGDVCNGKWGRCLPVGQSVTSISIGGQNKFNDVGQYLQTIFAYAIRIAGILGVVVIITAGLRWVTSGGNSEAVSSAKKMIGGAIMGVFLAFTSYFILNTLNPAFVNLRLPRTWMIRPLKLVSQFCSQAPSSTLFAPAADYNHQNLEVTVRSGTMYTMSYNGEQSANSRFRCGNRLFIKDGGDATCFGNVCAHGSQCVPLAETTDTKDAKKMDCYKGQLLVHYSMSSIGEQFAQNIPFAAKLIKPNWFDSSAAFWGVCKDQKFGTLSISNRYADWNNLVGDKEVTTIEHTQSGFNEYIVSYSGLDTARSKEFYECKEGADLIGFVLVNELNGNWDWGFNPNLNIGMDQTSGGAIVGAWSNVGARHYIPYDKLINEGVYLDVAVSSDVLDNVLNDKGSAPKAGEVQ